MDNAIELLAGLELRSVEWTEALEAPDQPLSWTITPGELFPAWAWNAIIRKELMPLPEPALGEMDWGSEGAPG